ncbi:unnamed protein product [Pleuronectes platessa]|uniref:Secreted protein n=1 Tax=Pleuronectes platessa TaxID=8262 RepID=A0A9N7YKW1_PLEPL|nr:unnamed protein product [Pleuronectes platessa]
MFRNVSVWLLVRAAITVRLGIELPTFRSPIPVNAFRILPHPSASVFKNDTVPRAPLIRPLQVYPIDQQIIQSGYTNRVQINYSLSHT